MIGFNSIKPVAWLHAAAGYDCGTTATEIKRKLSGWRKAARSCFVIAEQVLNGQKKGLRELIDEGWEM